MQLFRRSEVTSSKVCRLVFVVGLVGVAGLVVCSFGPSHDAPPIRHRSASAPTTADSSPDIASASERRLLTQVGDSLVALHDDDHGGWRFQSQIQTPNFQTDRDVGAAGVGMGFLVLADRYPDDPRWLDAARSTADWLMTVETNHVNGTVSWPDYVDSSNDISTSEYTSFDDGALGVSDFFWQIYEKTNDTTYKNTAINAVNWTLAQAENVGTSSHPAYRWAWDESTKYDPLSGDDPPIYSMGMGMGETGIIETLATYYQRTSSSNPLFAARCKQYIIGALNYTQRVKTTLAANGGDNRAIPETGLIGQNGDTEEDSGYVSGAAGAAFMYLKLYQVFGDTNYLAQANQLFSWLQDTRDGPMVQFSNDTVAWQIAVDPQDVNDPANTMYATGIEEGSAGVGWTYLQAYNLTGDKAYLVMAERAAGWLTNVAIKSQQGGWSWPEDEHPTSSYIHPNLDNGAAGIGIFFYDLYVATNDTRYLEATQGAAHWLMETVQHHGSELYWSDSDDGNSYSDDPSWHWGLAGIIDFLTRISGGTNDIPGEQQGL